MVVDTVVPDKEENMVEALDKWRRWADEKVGRQQGEERGFVWSFKWSVDVLCSGAVCCFARALSFSGPWGSSW